MKIKTVLFDLAGELVVATEWHFDALNRALGLFGCTILRYEHLTTYNGLPTRKKLELLPAEKNFPRWRHSLTNKIKQKHTREKSLRNCPLVFEKESVMHQLKRDRYTTACWPAPMTARRRFGSANANRSHNLMNTLQIVVPLAGRISTI